MEHKYLLHSDGLVSTIITEMPNQYHDNFNFRSRIYFPLYRHFTPENLLYADRNCQNYNLS